MYAILVRWKPQTHLTIFSLYFSDMDPVVSEFEELMLCGYCRQKFNDSELSPKLLSCKHYFCLQCTRTSLIKGNELYCVYCWKRTDLGEMGPESLPTYNPVLCLAKNFSQLSLGIKPPDKVSPINTKVSIALFHVLINSNSTWRLWFSIPIKKWFARIINSSMK